MCTILYLVLRSWLIDLQVRYVLENCKEDMEFFNQWVEKGIITRLTVCYVKHHLNLLPLVWVYYMWSFSLKHQVVEAYGL